MLVQRNLESSILKLSTTSIFHYSESIFQGSIADVEIIRILRRYGISAPAPLAITDNSRHNALSRIVKAIRTSYDNIRTQSSAYNIYQMYKITNVPSFTHLNQRTMEDFLSWYTRPVEIFARVLRSYRFVRVFSIVTFTCYNNQTGLVFNYNTNLGRIETSSVHDFQVYFKSALMRQFTLLMERDYITVLNIASIELHTLRYNPLVGAAYCAIPLAVKNS